jgi:thiosulfate/3-mercaptopyruvate sulfurtransferase
LTLARNRLSRLFPFSGLAILFAAAATFVSAPASRADEKKPSDPWTSAQIVQAGDFVRELGETNETRPTIVYVGFRTLFAGGHIPGATFHGTASTEQGLAELKKWADALPRTTNLVIYCGCCPLEKCPNIRPAFAAMSEMGFKRLRVLALPTSFAADWADKGYPVQKGT